ncbi:MAG TPA: DUF1345 domain-containing protein [Methylomirabilota bacterium]|nr:DUF1345 domain-containing protein [Methylomirabilota bacterium]
MSTKGRRIGRAVLPHRILRSRPRLFSSAGLGIVVTAVLAVSTAWRPASRLLVGWDVAVAVYLVLVFEMMAGSRVRDIRRRAAEQDEGQLAILVLTVAAGLASLAAIQAELASGSGGRRPGQLALASLTILLSWAFIHTMFALHYAHEFYGDSASPAGGMAFPGGDEEPDYWDFVYFSFVIGMTSQVSDVAITNKPVRRTVTAHAVVSFAFNVALLALTVNIAASAL